MEYQKVFALINTSASMLILAGWLTSNAQGASIEHQLSVSCVDDITAPIARRWDDDDKPGALRSGAGAPLVLTPVVWKVLAEPLVPVQGTDDRVHLAYELLFNNVTPDPVRMHSLHVVDPTQHGAAVGSYKVFAVDGNEITGLFRRFTLRPNEVTNKVNDYSNVLAPGQAAVVYIDLTFEEAERIPRVIAHQVTISRGTLQDAPISDEVEPPESVNAAEPPITAIGGCARVSKMQAVTVSPPLRGTRWLNANGCCAVIGPHRFVIIAASGTLRPPEHFAIDYLQLDALGTFYKDDPKLVGNWHGYGADILAVAPGIVVHVIDGLPDQIPLQPPVGINADTAPGNSVIVDIGHGRFAAYAHMIPGSVRVKVGQAVHRGQGLGRIGNSGSSSAPHLHFQIMNRPSFLDAVGLPFVFDRMELQGRLVGATDDVLDQLFARLPVLTDFKDAGSRAQQMPLTLDLMEYR